MIYKVGHLHTELNLSVEPDVREVLKTGETEVWYRREHAGALFGVDDPNTDDLNATHALMGKIVGTDPEELFIALQGEKWSPRGEANNMIWKNGAGHTSMSVGDVLVIAEQVHIVRSCGFKVL